MIKINLKTIFFYLDIDNLYGKAMSEYLPYGGFKWLEVNNETTKKVLNARDDSLQGYLLEVDLEMPKELHDEHNDLPMAPEKIRTIRTNVITISIRNKK